jgi:predicted transcriptional regulator
MRKIKEVLRLKWERGLSNRQIAAACGVSRPTVSEYLRPQRLNRRCLHVQRRTRQTRRRPE